MGRGDFGDDRGLQTVFLFGGVFFVGLAYCT